MFTVLMRYRKVELFALEFVCDVCRVAVYISDVEESYVIKDIKRISF